MAKVKIQQLLPPVEASVVLGEDEKPRVIFMDSFVRTYDTEDLRNRLYNCDGQAFILQFPNNDDFARDLTDFGMTYEEAIAMIEMAERSDE